MFSTYYRKLFGKSKLARKRMQAARRSVLVKPNLESLEGRRLLAFTTPVSYPVGTNPAGIAVGDFNGDAKDDMAVVNTGVSVSVLMSNGDGSFQPKVDYPVGLGAVDATAGDLNGDGKLDLIVVGAAVDVLLGNGDGTFGTAISFPVTPTAHSIKAGDFNNDGKIDIGTMNNNSASVLLGNGDGSLQAPLVSTVLGNNINLVTGDFNRDGKLDMATSNTASIGTINVLRGRGDGSFEPYSSYYAFSAPVYLATGDFNNDGYLDFACPNSYVATSMSVVMNNGDGTYAPPHTYGIAQTGYEIEVEDFNNDGYDDFAVRGGSKYMVSHGKGDGTFYPSVDFATPSGRFEAGTHGDFNGDGAVDLAYPSTNGVTVLSNDNADGQNLAGAVTFQVTAPATTTSRSVLPMTIKAVDANGNVATGFRGLVYISSSDPAASTASGYAFNPLDAGIPYLFTASDAGSHSFTGAIRLVTAGNQTVTVSAPNMTAASATVNVTGQVARLSVSAPAITRAGDNFNVTVSAIDTTGAVATGYTTTVHFTSSDALAGLPADYTFTPEDAGSHTFSVTLKSAGSRFIGAIETGGTIQGGATVSVSPQVAASLVLAGGAGAIGVVRPVSIVARDAFGNVATGYNGTVHFTSSDPAALLPADVDLVNGSATVNVKFLTVGVQTLTATDIATPSITGTLSSNATAPIANQFSVTGYPATTAGLANAFTVRVIDTIGQTATGYTGTVYFSSSDVQAGLPASYTFTAADAGVHNFAATLKTAGIQSITVRDLSGALIGTQAGISVDSAAFARFSLSVPNGADSKGHILVAAGDAISLTVRAVDTYGNSVGSYLGTIAFSSTDSTANIPANYVFTAADGGSHTFTVDLRTVTPNGVVWSFSVVDVSLATTLATITNFEVVNAVASSIKLTAPTNSVAGEGFTSRATVLDAYGNTVKNYFGTVHFASSSLNASLPADYTFDGADGGVHDFFLLLNTSGIQAFSAVDTTDALVTGSDSLTISPAAAASIRIEAPATSSAGTVQTINVSVVDEFGNIATDYRGTVAFASSDAQAVLPASYAFANKDSGFHAFTATLKTAGTQTVSASDTASGLSSQAAVNVTPATVAGSFTVAGIPTTVAGAAQSFTVTVKDAYGNLATGYTGTVNFSSSDTQAGLPASYTFTAADAGSKTFSATLKTAGIQSVTVRDAANATAIGTQSNITVRASAVAASVTVSGFPATTAGVAQNFTVAVKDAYGNLCSSFTGTVSFSSNDAKAVLPASYTFTAADAGSHRFSATLKTAGTKSITATTAGLSSTQSGIVVSAAAVSNFQVVAPVITQGVGFKLTVTALDAFGNIVTNYRGKVNVTSTNSSGSNSYSFSNKDAGVAQISYTLNTLGTQTIKVADSSNASIFTTITVNVLKK